MPVLDGNTHTHTERLSLTLSRESVVCNISQRLHVTSFRSIHPVFRGKKVLDLSGFPARSPVAQPATELDFNRRNVPFGCPGR